MPITVNCPSCSKQLRAADNLAGRQVLCPQCKTRVTVPGEGITAAPPPIAPPPFPAPPASGHSQGSALLPDGVQPHRGNVVMILGIMSFVVAPIILGPIAWVMGRNDLKAMDEGRMDPEGRANTNTGKICGMISTIFVSSMLGLVMVGFFCCFGGVGLLGIMGTSSTQSFQPIGGPTDFPTGSAGDAAETFCVDLYLDDPDSAYDQLTTARQTLWTVQQFRGELDKRPTIKDSDDYNVRPSTRRNDPNAFDGEFILGTKRQDITVLMVQEGGDWKVDEVLFWD